MTTNLRIGNDGKVWLRTDKRLRPLTLAELDRLRGILMDLKVRL